MTALRLNFSAKVAQTYLLARNGNIVESRFFVRKISPISLIFNVLSDFYDEGICLLGFVL